MGGGAVELSSGLLRGMPGGAEWLERLPRLAAECVELWELELGLPSERTARSSYRRATPC